MTINELLFRKVKIDFQLKQNENSRFIPVRLREKRNNWNELLTPKQNDSLDLFNFLRNFLEQSSPKFNASLKNGFLTETSFSIKYYNFLNQQLKMFEENFKKYLGKKVKAYKEFGDNQKLLLQQLIGKQKCNLLDFNYTTFSPELKNQIITSRNIHGDLNGNIIIGFDQSSIKDDDPYYQFTKSFQLLNHLEQNSKSFPDLLKNIDNIIFYGHSLSPEDYSYFMAIFDDLDLYSSNINITFGWTNHDNSAAFNLLKQVNDLINKYGSQLDPSHGHGKNLLQKLELENRIHFKEIPKREDLIAKQKDQS